MADDEKPATGRKGPEAVPGKAPDASQPDAGGTRYTRNLSPAARKRVMDRAKIIDRLLEDEDEEGGE